MLPTPYDRPAQTEQSDYDQACNQAAKDQGLLPIVGLLTEAGIPWNLEQTGGFCMVINVNHVDETYYLWLTVALDGEPESGIETRVLIGMYDGSDGELIGDSDEEAYDNVPLSALVETVNERRNA